MIKINCRHSDGGIGCTCPNVKRKLWGMGARLCVEFENTGIRSVQCQFKEEYPKPTNLPPPPPPRAVSGESTMFPSIRNTTQIIAEYNERIVELEAALQFYSKRENYIKRPISDGSIISRSNIDTDEGTLARQTLKGES